MQERRQLTQRFVELFNQSSLNGGAPYDLIAKTLSVSTKTIKRYEKQIDFITCGDAYLLYKNLDWSLNFMFQDITNWEEKVADELGIGFDSNFSAKAGYSIINQPFITCVLNEKTVKNRFVHEVNGDSMFTDCDGIENGDKLESERVFELSYILENKIYIVETEDGSRVKKLNFKKNKDNKITGFQLNSTLPEIFISEQIDADERIKVYKIINIIKESKRKKLQTAISNDKLEVVIDILIQAFENIDVDDLNHLLSLKRQLKSVKRDFGTNCIDQSCFYQQKSKICRALLDFIKDINKYKLVEIDTCEI